MTANTLYYGDNLTILRNPNYIKDESVDLVYIDPPFNSNASYNILFKEQNGARAAGQIKAFTDTWRWDAASSLTYDEVTASGGKVAQALKAYRQLLGTSDMLAYLTMMAPRLVELHRVLKSTGSFYLHCDPAASHYLKVLLDAVFGPAQFRNEISWKRTTAHSSAKKFAPIHDVILYYSKSQQFTWNGPRLDYDQAYLDKYYRFDDGDGRLYWRDNLCAAGTRNGRSGVPWRGIDPTAKGMHWKFTVERLDELDAAGRIYWPPRGTMPQYKRYRDELKGKAIADFWDDIDRINPVGNERQGYPTQKPLALLTRIIEASSNEGDVILDAFCGCGTAVVAAQALERRWIGIDITYAAMAVIRNRLNTMFGAGTAPKPIGEPETIEDATILANTDRYQFQWWALGLVDARPMPMEQKKGADQGIDGRLAFDDEDTGYIKEVIFSVKSGPIPPGHIRELRGVIEREGAPIGALITFHGPTRDMKREAASAGTYESPRWGRRYPRLQILTVAELLNGKRLDCPPLSQVNRTMPKAPRHQRPAEGHQPPLPGANLVDVSKQADTEASLLRSVGRQRAQSAGD